MFLILFFIANTYFLFLLSRFLLSYFVATVLRKFFRTEESSQLFFYKSLSKRANLFNVEGNNVHFKIDIRGLFSEQFIFLQVLMDSMKFEYDSEAKEYDSMNRLFKDNIYLRIIAHILTILAKQAQFHIQQLHYINKNLMIEFKDVKCTYSKENTLTFTFQTSQSIVTIANHFRVTLDPISFTPKLSSDQFLSIFNSEYLILPFEFELSNFEFFMIRNSLKLSPIHISFTHPLSHLSLTTPEISGTADIEYPDFTLKINQISGFCSRQMCSIPHLVLNVTKIFVKEFDFLHGIKPLVHIVDFRGSQDEDKPWNFYYKDVEIYYNTITMRQLFSFFTEHIFPFFLPFSKLNNISPYISGCYLLMESFKFNIQATDNTNCYFLCTRIKLKNHTIKFPNLIQCINGRKIGSIKNVEIRITDERFIHILSNSFHLHDRPEFPLEDYLTEITLSIFSLYPYISKYISNNDSFFPFILSFDKFLIKFHDSHLNQSIIRASSLIPGINRQSFIRKFLLQKKSQEMKLVGSAIEKADFKLSEAAFKDYRKKLENVPKHKYAFHLILENLILKFDNRDFQDKIKKIHIIDPTTKQLYNGIQWDLLIAFNFECTIKSFQLFAFDIKSPIINGTSITLTGPNILARPACKEKTVSQFVIDNETISVEMNPALLILYTDMLLQSDTFYFYYGDCFQSIYQELIIRLYGLMPKWNDPSPSFAWFDLFRAYYRGQFLIKSNQFEVRLPATSNFREIDNYLPIMLFKLNWLFRENEITLNAQRIKSPRVFNGKEGPPIIDIPPITNTIRFHFLTGIQHIPVQRQSSLKSLIPKGKRIMTPGLNKAQPLHRSFFSNNGPRSNPCDIFDTKSKHSSTNISLDSSNELPINSSRGINNSFDYIKSNISSNKPFVVTSQRSFGRTVSNGSDNSLGSNKNSSSFNSYNSNNSNQKNSGLLTKIFNKNSSAVPHQSEDDDSDYNDEEEEITNNKSTPDLSKNFIVFPDVKSFDVPGYDSYKDFRARQLVIDDWTIFFSKTESAFPCITVDVEHYNWLVQPITYFIKTLTVKNQIHKKFGFRQIKRPPIKYLIELRRTGHLRTITDTFVLRVFDHFPVSGRIQGSSFDFSFNDISATIDFNSSFIKNSKFTTEFKCTSLAINATDLSYYASEDKQSRSQTIVVLKPFNVNYNDITEIEVDQFILHMNRLLIKYLTDFVYSVNLAPSSSHFQYATKTTITDFPILKASVNIKRGRFYFTSLESDVQVVLAFDLAEFDVMKKKNSPDTALCFETNLVFLYYQSSNKGQDNMTKLVSAEEVQLFYAKGNMVNHFGQLNFTATTDDVAVMKYIWSELFADIEQDSSNYIMETSPINEFKINSTLPSISMTIMINDHVAEINFEDTTIVIQQSQDKTREVRLMVMNLAVKNKLKDMAFTEAFSKWAQQTFAKANRPHFQLVLKVPPKIRGAIVFSQAEVNMEPSIVNYDAKYWESFIDFLGATFDKPSKSTKPFVIQGINGPIMPFIVYDSALFPTTPFQNNKDFSTNKTIRVENTHHDEHIILMFRYLRINPIQMDVTYKNDYNTFLSEIKNFQGQMHEIIYHDLTTTVSDLVSKITSDVARDILPQLLRHVVGFKKSQDVSPEQEMEEWLRADDKEMSKEDKQKMLLFGSKSKKKK